MKRNWILPVVAAITLADRGVHASAVVEAMLWEGSTPATLRAQLLNFVATAPESAVAGKGAALYYAGSSFEREGKGDSARILFEQAVAVRGLALERDALVDALLAPNNPEDARRALDVLEPRHAEALRGTGGDLAVTRGRQAWALYNAGQGDSALLLMRPQERWLLNERTPGHRDWRYRLGLLELEHGSAQRSVEVMSPLALDSRFQDRDVMGILRDGMKRSAGVASNVSAILQRELLTYERAEQALLDALGARRVSLATADGFPVSGVAFVPAGRRPARAVLAVVGPDELFEAYDSLATGLRRAGYAVLLIESRGSGHSVSPVCPLPETWRGREAEMHARVARDVLAGLRALAAATAVDTTRYLVAGAGPMASVVVEAASLDRRARPLLLLGPQPAPVDRGVMRARLRKIGAPVFYEVPVMDRESLPVAEALYALDPRGSRIAESELIGRGAAVFRRDVSALPRLVQWLDDSWSPGPRARGPRQ